MRSKVHSSEGRQVDGSARRSSRALAGVTALVLVGAALLGGCSARPGVAAVVGDRTISQSELETAQKDLLTVVAKADASNVLSALVAAPFFIDAAAENGVGVSADEARAAIEKEQVSAQASAGSDAGAPATVVTPVPLGDDAVQIIQFSMALDKIRTLSDADTIITGVTDKIAATHLDVNPRYGQMDPGTGSITPLALPWIVAPKA
ncbi:MAG TPA: hypothetical protein VGK35_00040 [Actinotalea sp.]